MNPKTESGVFVALQRHAFLCALEAERPLNDGREPFTICNERIAENIKQADLDARASSLTRAAQGGSHA